MSFPLSKMISMIKSTAKKKRIVVVVTEESYTSLACFYDGDMTERAWNSPAQDLHAPFIGQGREGR